jgi:hypothetical protein
VSRASPVKRVSPANRAIRTASTRRAGR